jgi:hypothetical protein
LSGSRGEPVVDLVARKSAGLALLPSHVGLRYPITVANKRLDVVLHGVTPKEEEGKAPI